MGGNTGSNAECSISTHFSMHMLSTALKITFPAVLTTGYTYKANLGQL